MTEEMMLFGFSEHIEEIRRRLLYSLIALIIGVFVSFIFADKIITLLVEPIGGLQNLQSIEVTENISVYMKSALLSGFILAIPFISYQVVAFVSPGLKTNEKHWLFLAIPFITTMFLLGNAFAYFIMLRAAIPFLISFLGVQTIPRLSNYIGFVTNLLFWVGISFESPLIFVILAKLKLVTAKMLLQGWRIAIMVSAVLAAVITPTTDPVNMGLLMSPLLGLYVFSVLLAFLVR